MLQISLSDIESVDITELNNKRLHTLENGYSPFEDVLNSKSDPITLDRSRYPYKILDGRHRIYLARKKGYLTINAKFA